MLSTIYATSSSVTQGPEGKIRTKLPPPNSGRIFHHIKHLLFVWLFFVIRSSDQNDLGQCISTLFQVTWYWNKQVLVNLKNVVRFVVTRITHRDNVPRSIYQTIFLNMASIKMASGRISPATRTLKENDWIFVSFPICQPRVFSC